MYWNVFLRVDFPFSAPTSTAGCALGYRLNEIAKCARASALYVYKRVYTYVYIYICNMGRAHGMHEYGMYTVTAHDDRRFDTAGLSRSPPPHSSYHRFVFPLPPGDDATRNDAQRAVADPIVKPIIPLPPKKFVHGSFFFFSMRSILIFCSLFLPGPRSRARFIGDADLPAPMLPFSQAEIFDHRLTGRYVIADLDYVMTYI